MDNVEEVKKAVKKMENPLEKSRKLPKFAENYEEELIKSLFEERAKSLSQRMEFAEVQEYSGPFVHHERPGEEWDVPITEEIKYFDPELSYELTGYRPITMEKGLDFDPEPFREMAALYEANGEYTKFPKGSKPHRDLWNREMDRMINGYTVGKYRITGDNYYYLNYYRMQTVPEGKTAGTGRTENFPMFLAKQYEWFHYIEIAEKVRLDAGALKARGVGWSEMTAALAVRPYTTNQGYNVLLTAAADNQLQPLLDKCWFQLDWLNVNTSGGLRHVRQKVNNNSTKRASKVLKDGTEVGWKSQIDSIVADEPKKIRGYRQDRLVFEECFGKGTKVIMADYSRKNIEDINVGDFVLGIDGTPQKVIKTCSGEDNLYKVTQKTGIDYIINSRHKIFFESRNCGPTTRFLMTPTDFLNRSNNHIITSYGLSCTGINNSKENDYELDPYYFGLWLGDGYSKNPNRIIVNIKDDHEIVNYLISYYSTFEGGYIDAVRDTNDNCRIYCRKGYSKGENPIIRQYKKLGLYGNKHIPKEVLKSSMEYKLKVLAGIIDTDGYIKSPKLLGKSFEIEMSRPNLIREIGELAQTCGFTVSYSDRNRHRGFVKNHYINTAHIYSVTIKGDINRIPTLLPRKQVHDKRQQHTCTTGIRVEFNGYGEYYGFTLENYGKEWDHFFYLDDYTIVHNCGNNKNFIKSWVQGSSLTQLGGIHFGTKIFLGTSGQEIDMDGLAKMFVDPMAYSVLPYKNYDTIDGKPELTAFFLPAHKFALDSKYLDSRGVTNWVEFKKYYESERSKLTGESLRDECAEHCFYPEEALAKTGENMFDSELVSTRLTQILTSNDFRKPKPISLLWEKTTGKKDRVYAVDNPNSKLLVAEPPLVDEDGMPYKNLYVAGIDSIDMGTENSANDTDVSDFCIVIKKRIFGSSDPKYVAVYKDRPRDIRTAYETALKLLTWYNCRAMLEFTKISIQEYFRERKKEHLFMERPEFAVSNKNKQFKNKNAKRLIGIPSTGSIIQHGLELVAGFLNDYYYTIDYEEMLREMMKYSYENKRKFDMIAAMQCCEIGDEEMSNLAPKKMENSAGKWVDFGWYRDEKGNLHHGVIPKKTNNYAWKT